MTSRQRPQSFRELVADLYVYSVGFRSLARILDLLGCGVGAGTLWRDVAGPPAGGPRRPAWLEVDETWLSIGGAKQPVAVALGPKGQRLDLRLSGPGCDGGD